MQKEVEQDLKGMDYISSVYDVDGFCRSFPDSHMETHDTQEF